MSGPVRVLVVDDAAFMRRTLVNLLRAPDIEVVGEARNGREAVRLFEEARPDVICLDIDMPGMDGVTALKHFMSVRPTPVVVVSSMTDRDDIPFEIFRLGAIDFFPKPSAIGGRLAEQTRLLLYIVRNAHRIRVENLARVAMRPSEASRPSGAGLDHLLVVAGELGSVGALLRLLSLLPPRVQRGIGLLCMVPVQEPLVGSFRTSIERLFGWGVDRLETAQELATGRVCLARPGGRISIDGRGVCRWEGESATALDDLFAAAGRARGEQATMVLLAGSEPGGVAGLRTAHSLGSRCYVQDPETALFTTWHPEIPSGVEPLDLEDVADDIWARVELSGVAP